MRPMRRLLGKFGSAKSKFTWRSVPDAVEPRSRRWISQNVARRLGSETVKTESSSSLSSLQEDDFVTNPELGQVSLPGSGNKQNKCILHIAKWILAHLQISGPFSLVRQKQSECFVTAGLLLSLFLLHPLPLFLYCICRAIGAIASVGRKWVAYFTDDRRSREALKHLKAFIRRVIKEGERAVNGDY